MPINEYSPKQGQTTPQLYPGPIVNPRPYEPVQEPVLAPRKRAPAVRGKRPTTGRQGNTQSPLDTNTQTEWSKEATTRLRDWILANQEKTRVLEQKKVEQKKMEVGIIDFFDSLIDGMVNLITEPVKTLVPAILGAALFPILGPIAAGTVAIGTAVAMTSIPEDTINKLAKPLQEQQRDESDLLDKSVLPDDSYLGEITLIKIIEEILSTDRQVNKDLQRFFIDLVPTIEKAAKSAEEAARSAEEAVGSTNVINISESVQGLIRGDNNTITQTFNSFLPANGQNLTWDVNGHSPDGKTDILNGEDTLQRQLREALLSAFPTRPDLEMMVSDGLHKNLSAIASDSNLEHTAFELIRWSRTRGRLEELVIAALKQNSQNPQLLRVAEQFGLGSQNLPCSFGTDETTQKIATSSSVTPTDKKSTIVNIHGSAQGTIINSQHDTITQTFGNISSER